jgi:hypothetical protein
MSETLNEGDLLTKAALEDCGARIQHLLGIKEAYDVSIFRHEGLCYAYKLSWMVEGNEIDFMLQITKVTPGPRGGKPKVEIVVDRQFTERIEA